MIARWACAAVLACTAACGASPGRPSTVGHARASQGDPAFLARFLDEWAQTNRFRLGEPTGFRIDRSSGALYFLRSSADSFVRELWRMDPATGQERSVLSAERVLRGGEEQLGPEERARRERQRNTGRGIASYQLAPDGARVVVSLSGRLYAYEFAADRVAEIGVGGTGWIDPRFSPDSRRVAAVREGDLWVMDATGGPATRLTTHTGDAVSNGTAEFVAQEEMDRDEGYWWSGDSTRIVYQQNDEHDVERLHIFDPTHPERPASDTRYPRAGRANARVRLGIVAVTGGATTWVTWDAVRYPYLARVSWSEQAPLTLVVQNREQTDELILVTEPTTGVTRTIHREADAAWLNLEGDLPQWLDDGSAFLWSSERSGHWRLELRDRTGALVRELTTDADGYRGVIAVDAREGVVWIRGGAEPTESHVLRVRLDGHGTEAVTREPGEHDAIVDARSGSRLLISSTLTGPRRWAFFPARGATSHSVRSNARTPALLPRVEIVTVGTRQFRAAVLRPTADATTTRRPVIVSVYGGPHANMVTRNRQRYLTDQWLAEHGFIVVTADGRGTPRRGREWERALRDHAGDVPLEDQVAIVQALGARDSSLDLGRVGIQGWSYGGYMAAYAVLRRPDVFHAAVAGAPVVDWRDYDTHYTERYLGLPDASREAYDRASLLTYAANLERPLLLVHGTADDNVYFLHSARLFDALVRAGRTVEFVPLVGYTHIVPDPVVTRRLQQRVAEFFTRTLRP